MCRQSGHPNALGFLHEHQRYDANDTITINYQNIKNGYKKV